MKTKIKRFRPGIRTHSKAATGLFQQFCQIGNVSSMYTCPKSFLMEKKENKIGIVATVEYGGKSGGWFIRRQHPPHMYVCMFLVILLVGMENIKLEFK